MAESRYKQFPFTEVLTMISGKMVAERNNTDMLYDFVQFMLNDEHFCEEARAEAPRLTMEHFLEVVSEVVEELKRQYPELEHYEIPESFATEANPTAISHNFWRYVEDAIMGPVLVKSLDRY